MKLNNRWLSEIKYLKSAKKYIDRSHEAIRYTKECARREARRNNKAIVFNALREV